MAQWNKRLLLLFSLLTITLLLTAHEFWLQPEKFIYEPAETINIRFEVGENFEGVNWTGNATKINSLKLYLDRVKDDLTQYISDASGDSLQLALFDEGTAMVTFNSKNSFIELDGAKFNEYLREIGLDSVILDREKKKETNNSGKEFNQRSVKTLIQVGAKTTNCFKQSTDLPLDIIPQNNPSQLKNNQPIVLKVLFKNKPLIGYDIRVWHRIGDTTLQQRIRTDEKGELRFNVNTTGYWMVSTVKMNRLVNDSSAEWQSYWGSLTWGY